MAHADAIALDRPDTAAMIYQHRDRTYGYVLTLVRDPAEAEDLTEDTLLRAYHCCGPR